MKTRPKINFNCYEGLCQIIQLETAPEHMSVWTAWTAEASNTRGELAAPIGRLYSQRYCSVICSALNRFSNEPRHFLRSRSPINGSTSTISSRLSQTNPVTWP
jgi:hypothetical protein